MITKVTVTFELEHLTPLDNDAIESRLEEMMISTDDAPWINQDGYYAILKDETISVSIDWVAANDQD